MPMHCDDNMQSSMDEDRTDRCVGGAVTRSSVKPLDHAAALPVLSLSLGPAETGPERLFSLNTQRKAPVKTSWFRHDHGFRHRLGRISISASDASTVAAPAAPAVAANWILQQPAYIHIGVLRLATACLWCDLQHGANEAQATSVRTPLLTLRSLLFLIATRICADQIHALPFIRRQQSQEDANYLLSAVTSQLPVRAIDDQDDDPHGFQPYQDI